MEPPAFWILLTPKKHGAWYDADFPTVLSWIIQSIQFYRHVPRLNGAEESQRRWSPSEGHEPADCLRANARLFTLRGATAAPSDRDHVFHVEDLQKTGRLV